MHNTFTILYILQTLFNACAGREGTFVTFYTKKHFMPNYSDEGNYTSTTPTHMPTHMRTSSYCDKVLTSLQKQPFLLAPRRWGSSAKRNVCDSATEIPYWWPWFCQAYVSLSDSAKALLSCRLRKCVQWSAPWRWKSLPVSVCLLCATYFVLMSPLCKKCPNNNNNNNNNTRISIAPFRELNAALQ